jgi:hypothetical protein
VGPCKMESSSRLRGVPDSSELAFPRGFGEPNRGRAAQGLGSVAEVLAKADLIRGSYGKANRMEILRLDAEYERGLLYFLPVSYLGKS